MVDLRHSAPRLLAEGLGWPEGPTVLADGSVAFVETYRSQLSVWRPGETGAHQFAYVGGGPNAAVAGKDGALYFTQNGGVVGPWRATDHREPGIWCVQPFGAPNDLVFAPDGRLYFTDPGEGFDPANRRVPGRIFALEPDGAVTLIAGAGTTFPNGLAVGPDGVLYWVESYTRDLVRHPAGGGFEVIATLREGAVPDGLKVTEDGVLFVTTSAGGTVDVLTAEGAPVGEVRIDRPDAVLSNCVFDGGTLYVTDGGCVGGTAEPSFTGRLWAIDFPGLRGLPAVAGRIG